MLYMMLLHIQGDDESICCNLRQISQSVDAVVFTVHCYSGGSFASVQSAYARLVMPATGHELAMFKLGKQNTSQGIAFAM
jgi:stress response protein SCP2